MLGVICIVHVNMNLVRSRAFSCIIQVGPQSFPSWCVFRLSWPQEYEVTDVGCLDPPSTLFLSLKGYKEGPGTEFMPPGELLDGSAMKTSCYPDP